MCFEGDVLLNFGNDRMDESSSSRKMMNLSKKPHRKILLSNNFPIADWLGGVE